MSRWTYVLSIFLLGASAAQAGVHFLVQDGEMRYNDNVLGESSSYNSSLSKKDQPNKCQKEGYVYTRCPAGMVPRGRCPYSTMYYAECCPADYRYTEKDCQAMGKKTGKFSCGGFFACQ